MFDWDRFKKGKIKVILRTEQLAKDFYKECKKRRIDWSRCDYAIWNEGGIVYKYCTISNSLVWNGIIDDGQESVEWKGVNCMKELTFKEVIANIKENEVWESNEKTITIKYDQVIIQVKEGYEGRVNGNERMALSLDKKYKLQRKEYTFEEAFKAYEEGKEIESNYSGCRYKKEKGKDTFMFLADWREFDSIDLEEIRGKWYIND